MPIAWVADLSYPTPSATATTRASATSTPTPSVTPTPGPPFTGSIVATDRNCGLTLVYGVVNDASGKPLPGIRIRLTWDAPDAQTYYTYAGSKPEFGPSGWDIFLNGMPVENTWRVAVVDEAGTLLSPDLPVHTDGHCNDGATNVVRVHFTGTSTLPQPLRTKLSGPIKAPPPLAN